MAAGRRPSLSLLLSRTRVRQQQALQTVAEAASGLAAPLQLVMLTVGWAARHWNALPLLLLLLGLLWGPSRMSISEPSSAKQHTSMKMVLHH